jgi:hypothetical protein
MVAGIECLVELGRPKPQSIEFDFPDELARRAARETWSSLTLSELRTRDLVWVAFGLVPYALSVLRRSAWYWQALFGVVPALVVLLTVAWFLFGWLVAREAVKKLAHLPHRGVVFAFDAKRLSFRTATEQLEVPRTEVKEVRELPSFVLLRLRGGADLPIPLAALDSSTLDRLKRLAP